MTGEILTGAVTIVFCCGMAWTWLKQVRRDVNGLGRKINKLQLLAVANEADESKRKELARMILEP
jgi:hypothetical protein